MYQYLLNRPNKANEEISHFISLSLFPQIKILKLQHNISECFALIIQNRLPKGIVGLDLRWKYDVKLFPAKKLASDWLSS